MDGEGILRVCAVIAVIKGRNPKDAHNTAPHPNLHLSLQLVNTWKTPHWKMINQDVVDDIAETVRTNYVGIAGFTILIWDHLDTFPTEVEYIWKPMKKGPIVYLFLLNRYLTPLGFMVNLFAYFSPVWTPERYENFT
ncbi:hypothetical protein B0H13DRAFT_2522825 [Mycena leptocephala]|nr:hypothetical protein B0H13DRAFT_2522825 [Mycena leptocephala]